MFAFRAFSKNDWESYAGAEPLADGSDPLISTDDLVIDGEPAEIIVDGAGVQIFWSVDDAPYSARVEGADGAPLLAILRPRMTHAGLAAVCGVSIERC